MRSFVREGIASFLRADLPKGWRVGDNTGDNGKDAAGDIAVT